MWIIKVQALSISNWRSLSWISVGFFSKCRLRSLSTKSQPVGTNSRWGQVKWNEIKQICVERGVKIHYGTVHPAHTVLGCPLNFSLVTVTNAFLDWKVPTKRHIGCNKTQLTSAEICDFNKRWYSFLGCISSPMMSIIYMPRTPEKNHIGLDTKKILISQETPRPNTTFFPRLPR